MQGTQGAGEKGNSGGMCALWYVSVGVFPQYNVLSLSQQVAEVAVLTHELFLIPPLLSIISDGDIDCEEIGIVLDDVVDDVAGNRLAPNAPCNLYLIRL